MITNIHNITIEYIRRVDPAWEAQILFFIGTLI